MLFQFENKDDKEDAYIMWMCRRYSMLSDEEITKMKEDNPEGWTEDAEGYNEHIYNRFTEYHVEAPSYSGEILEEEVPEEFMPEYKNIRAAIEEKDKYKVNGMKTGKFFKSKKTPFGVAFTEDTRPLYCFLYKAKVWNFLENQENIPGKPHALRMRIYSEAMEPQWIFGDGGPNEPPESENEEDSLSEDEESAPTCTYAEYIMYKIRQDFPIGEEGSADPEQIRTGLDWKQICMTEDFNEEFLEEYKDFIDWNTISKWQILSESFIDKYSDKLNWKNICRFQTLSESFIEEHSDKVYWPYIIAHQNKDEMQELPKYLIFKEDALTGASGVQYWPYNVSSLNTISKGFILKHTGDNDKEYDTTWDEVTSAGITEKWIDDNKDIVDWTAVCYNARMSEEFMDEHEAYLDWKALLEARDNLSPEFLNKHKDKVDWVEASKTQNLTPQIIDEYYDQLDWKEVCKNQQLNEELIDKYSSRIDWNALLSNVKFTEEQLDKYFDKLVWLQVVACQDITPEWIDKHANDLSEQDWVNTCNYIVLPEWFVRKHKEKVYWPAISGPTYTWLTETFIDEFKDYVDWKVICIYQKLSQQFLLDHFDKISWKHMSMNKYIDEDFIDKNKKKLDWNAICSYHKLSEQFIRGHQDYVVWFTVFKYQELSDEFKQEFKWNLTKEQRQELGL